MPEVGDLRVTINEPAEGRLDALQVNAFGGQNSSLVVTRESRMVSGVQLTLVHVVSDHVAGRVVRDRVVAVDDRID